MKVDMAAKMSGLFDRKTERVARNKIHVPEKILSGIDGRRCTLGNVVMLDKGRVLVVWMMGEDSIEQSVDDLGMLWHTDRGRLLQLVMNLHLGLATE